MSKQMILKFLNIKINQSFLNKNEIIGSGNIEINNNVAFVSGKFLVKY